MEELNYIKLPINLGIYAAQYLEKLGIPPRKDKQGGLTLKFTQKELDMVEEVKIDVPLPGCLDGIEHFHKIKKLYIDFLGYDAYNNRNSSITDKDIKVISSLTSLESLTIKRQEKISWVDVSKLVNLKELVISRNDKIDEVYGLEKLHQIEELSIYGNKELYSMEGIRELLSSSKTLDLLELDLFSYPEVSDLNTILLNITNCNFIETCRSGHEIRYNRGNAMFFHQKCMKIIEEIMLRMPRNNREKIMLVERYIAEYIKYDHAGLKTKDRHHEIDGRRVGHSYGTQSAFNGIMYNSCVCEGYSRAMQYLLKLMGIKSKNVYCVSGKDKIKVNKFYHNQVELPDDGYHSIIRVEDNYELYYCDPCWDATEWRKGDKSLPYCLRNRTDMEKDHTLSFEEEGILGVYPSIRSDYIQSVINRPIVVKEEAVSFKM